MGQGDFQISPPVIQDYGNTRRAFPMQTPRYSSGDCVDGVVAELRPAPTTSKAINVFLDVHFRASGVLYLILSYQAAAFGHPSRAGPHASRCGGWREYPRPSRALLPSPIVPGTA